MLPLLFACAPSATPDTAADTSDTSIDASLPRPELAFRYIVIGDPHVSDPSGDNLDRLDLAVAWINAEAADRDVRFVLVLGDIAWDDGVDAAAASLEALTIPWVPMIGDNEVHFGAGASFSEAFAPQYTTLSETFADWEEGPIEVEDPDTGRVAWLHNLAFSYEGVRMVGLDFASRDDNDLLSEFGQLHDFEGGTFSFFEDQLLRASVGRAENVVMFSHIPMHFPEFDLAEMERITAVTAPLGDHVWADLAGHYHFSASETVEGTGYDLHVTDATWDDEIELRIVEVWAAGDAFLPTTELVTVPMPP